MKTNRFVKLIAVVLVLSAMLAAPVSAAAADAASKFPYVMNMDMDVFDKLCYAGHITGGGMFYDDGYMITPDVSFSVTDRLGLDEESYERLSVEIDLIYENSDNTGTVKEVIKKYDYGDLKPGKLYPLFSDTAYKNLKQRKKLYSSDVMSIKVIISYKTDGPNPKKLVHLFYVAKDGEYSEKLTQVSAPPGN